jgi:hypothetical protein
MTELHSTVCQYCHTQFFTIDLALAHQATCPDVPAVIEEESDADRKLGDLLDSLAGVEGQMVSLATASILLAGQRKAESDRIEAIADLNLCREQLAVAQDEVERLTVREEQRVISHAVLSRIINTRLAEIRTLQDRLDVAKRFIATTIKDYAWGLDIIDGGDLQARAVANGILLATTYDPALHGEQDVEVGDPWYVIAPEWRVEP